MTDRQCGHPFPTGVEEWLASDEQCNSRTLCERCKGRLDVAVAAGFDNHEFLSARVRRGLHISQLSLSVSGVFEFGSTSIAIAPGLGINWRSSSSRFVTDALERKLTPVVLPPGRLRLATRPLMTGSLPVTNTIGTVVVAALAASAEGVFPTIRATCWRTKSATRAGNRWA